VLKTDFSDQSEAEHHLLLYVALVCHGLTVASFSRRAVTEHQLMHDRGRNIQSLKRLIWLSSAIDSLHTAETRSAPSYPTKVLDLDLVLDPPVVPAARISQPDQVRSLLRNFFKSPLTELPNAEP
uniref:Uncharacterized protein n=1 Tax=Gouania willdenowi TaxID=441366 RepID=A0A8C5DQJ8_GOUWI